MTYQKPLIYAVDDEEPIRELFLCALTGAGFEAEGLRDFAELTAAVERRLPDLILLDVMLEGTDGFRILESLRGKADTRDIPVILVSAKGEEFNKVKGLDLGADDYIAKPFGVLELIARVRANLRKRPRSSECVYKDIALDENQREITVGGRPLALTRKEYGLLRLLILNARRVVTREEIFEVVWGERCDVETRTLDIHVAALRKAIAASEAKIETTRGVGFCLK